MAIKTRRNFKTTERGDVPTARKRKHWEIVTQLLSDLEGLGTGHALKIALSELPDTKVNIRSALHRATRKFGKSVATAADEEYLYVWNS